MRCGAMAQPSALLIGILVLVLGVAVYAPGLSGDYVFDDYTNIVENTALRPEVISLESLIAAAVSSDSGPLKRPLASLSFLANFHFFGVNPLSFKVTNLIIHLLNGCLVFYLLRGVLPRLLPSSAKVLAVAGLTAIVWTVHPLNLTGVLYVVQRMTSLAASFSLLAMICYVHARERGIADPACRNFWWWSAIVIFEVLGVATKESALLLPIFLVLIELTVFRFRAAAYLKWLYGAGALISVSGLCYLLGPLDYFGDAYRERPFTANERMLTESRILVVYLEQLLLPNPTGMALVHPDWPLSRNLWTPWTTLAAVGFWLSAISASLVASKRYPIVMFGIGWYLVGHLIESTFVPLDLIYEHRNYLPSIGILCLACLAVVHVGAWRPTTGKLITFGVIVILGAMTAYRAWQWSEPFTLALTEARHNPTSARARYEYGRVLFQSYLVDRKPQLLEKSRRELWAAVKYGDEDFHPLAGLVHSYVRTREPVPEQLMEAYERELRDELPTARRLDAVYLAIKCQMGGSCPPTPEVVLRGVSATLANARLTPDLKAKMLEWLTLYYSNVLGDLAAARSVIQEAVLAQPEELVYQLRLLEIMVSQQDWVAAKKEHARLEPAFTLWLKATEPFLAKRFDELRAKLAAKNPPESDVR